MGEVTVSNLDHVFKYHPPAGDFQIEQYHKIRAAAKDAARAVLDATAIPEIATALDTFEKKILELTGPCRDQDSAIVQINVARMALQAKLELDAFEAGNVVDAPPPAALPDAATIQHIITNIRGAVMWANASLALKGAI